MGSVLDCVVSRWGDQGYVVEADWSQLEVIYAAHVSKDTNLINDILSGKDLHCQNAALISEYTYDQMLEGKELNCPVRTAIRKKAKSFSFQLGYGAGAASIALDVGADIKEVQAFIDAYYKRYSGLKAWQQQNIQTVKRSGKYLGKRTAKGLPARTSTLISETGRRYRFTETDAPQYLKDKGVPVSFSPTNIKNYPVQGGATGDIVPMVLGKLYRTLKSDPELKDKCLLINTVHDSVILDVHEQVLDKSIKVVQTVMQDAPKQYKQVFGTEFILDLPCEVTYGRSWSEAKQ